MESDLIQIRNIGPASARSLIAAGVPDAAALYAMGADNAYRALLLAGEKPHFISYYVLHMAVQGRPWNDCKGDEKVAMRAKFDALVADLRPQMGLEAELDRLGLRKPA